MRLLLASLMAAAQAYADTPLSNEEYEAYSADGKSYIHMIPEPGFVGGYGPGKGIAYHLSEKNKPEKLWEVNIFSSAAHLTNDGKSLIIFGPWARGLSDLAVAFYAGGKKLKSYSVNDLIDDPRKVERSVSHIMWQAPPLRGRKGLFPDQEAFGLTLIDGSVCVFDVASGKILERIPSTKRPPSPTPLNNSVVWIAILVVSAIGTICVVVIGRMYQLIVARVRNPKSL